MCEQTLLKSHKKKKETSFDKTIKAYSLFGNQLTAGWSKMPVLEPFNGKIPTVVVPFNIAYSKGITDCTVHFYIDDSQFERVFNTPEKYLPFLKSCNSVIGPDFSQYSNMPYAARLHNCYRNRAISAYWKENGVQVIPNVTWSLPDSYEYSFTGMPQNSIIAINCNGIQSSPTAKYLWYKGYNMACTLLKPVSIVRYGAIMEDEFSEISTYFSNERLKTLENGRKWK